MKGKVSNGQKGPRFPIARRMEREMGQVCISASIYEQQVRSELNVGFYRLLAIGWYYLVRCCSLRSVFKRTEKQKA